MSTEKPISYQVLLSNPQAHIFTVRCEIPDPDPNGQEFSIPAWIPGSYMIRDFAKNIVQIHASCGQAAVTCEKLDKQTWRCAPCAGTLIVEYQVYAWDLSVRSAHLDTTHGFFNGTSLFIQVRGKAHQRCVVEIIRPSGKRYATWRLATAMERVTGDEYEFGTFTAADYDELVDHPVEMGDFSATEFEAGGVAHALILTGKYNTDSKRIAADLVRVCESHIALFGELPKMEKYYFLVMVVGEGYGGLEHRASTSLLCSRDDLPKKGEKEISERYRTFLGLCSHEYFHTWNVKRIKPAVFQPYDLTKETYTRLLWAFEGITSYYDDLGLLRAGLIDSNSYLELLSQSLTRVYRSLGRQKQTLSESSLDAWSKFYKQDENAVNAIVSYYTKGAMVALALDLTIRKQTQSQKSLDDVMRHLWQNYGSIGKGIPENALERIIMDCTGIDLTFFFDQCLRSVDEIELTELFSAFAVEMQLRAAEGRDDKGGKFIEAELQNAEAGVLGVRTMAEPFGARLVSVLDESAAQQAGLSAGDLLIAIDDIQVKHDRLPQHLERYTAGNRVSVHVFRRDELLRFEVALLAPIVDTVALRSIDGSNEQARRQTSWFQSAKTDG